MTDYLLPEPSRDPVIMPSINGLTSELSLRIATSLKELRQDDEAYSVATWRMVYHCWDRWVAYCREAAIMPLPVEPIELRHYLILLAKSLSFSSVQAHLHAINFVQRNAKLPSVTKEPAITRCMRKLRRKAVENAEHVGQAIPLRLDDLRLLTVLYRDKGMLYFRDLAMLVTAYHTLLREAEFARLRVRDVQNGENGTGMIYVARTKTSITIAGEYRPLSAWGLKIVRAWIAAAGLEGDDYLFCKVSKHGAVSKATKPLNGLTIDNVFRRAYLALGNEPLEASRYCVWTGHSARVGAAMDLASKGYTAAQIMQAGGWKTPEMVMRYIRRITIADSVMVQMTTGAV